MKAEAKVRVMSGRNSELEKQGISRDRKRPGKRFSPELPKGMLLHFGDSPYNCFGLLLSGTGRQYIFTVICYSSNGKRIQ